MRSGKPQFPTREGEVVSKQVTLAIAIIAASVIAVIAIIAPSELRQHLTTGSAAGPHTEHCPLLDPRSPLRPIPKPPLADPREVALGAQLFHDRRLSADDSISCASCHVLALGGADGRPRSIGVGGAIGAINAPTVLNSGLLFAQFWDGRARTLEEQIDGPLHDPAEMASWPDVLAKLARDPALVQRFRELYPEGLQKATVNRAIATFERSLLTPDSPFDRWLCGDKAALDASAARGYALFTEYGCVSCHQGVAVGGNMFQKFGVVGDYFASRASTASDLGRYNVTGELADRHVFKVPSLRNVALTAPYFHDASAPTLEVAVTVMARYQLGRALPNDDLADIVAFLGSLTGELPRVGGAP